MSKNWTADQRRVYWRQWRAARLKQGKCGNCYRRRAGETVGGLTGTKTCCGLCAAEKRTRSRKRPKIYIPRVESLKIEQMRELRDTARIERMFAVLALAEKASRHA